MDKWEAQTVPDNNPQLSLVLILFPSNIVFLDRRPERKCVCSCVVMSSLIVLSLNIMMAAMSETMAAIVLTYYFPSFVVWQLVNLVSAGIILLCWSLMGGWRNRKNPNHRKMDDPFSVRLFRTYFFFLCHCPWSKTDRKEVGLLHRGSKNTSVPLCKVWDEATEISGTAAFPLGSNISSPALVSAHYFVRHSPCFHPSLAV